MAIHFLDDETKEMFSEGKKYLYRVMPLDRFVEILNKKRWSFVSPTLWNDPFEKAFLNAEYNHNGNRFYLPIAPTEEKDGPRYKLFCMCLTQTRESEAFWKTYSPNSDGISICIDAVKLKNALSRIQDYDVCIGKANYEKFDELYKFRTDSKFWKDLNSKEVNDTQLKLMLKKRQPFFYENEIRIMLLRKKTMKSSVAKVLIPNTIQLIYKIRLDPRMGANMYRLVKEALTKFGLNKSIIWKSKLYSKPDGTILFLDPIINDYSIF